MPAAMWAGVLEDIKARDHVVTFAFERRMLEIDGANRNVPSLAAPAGKVAQRVGDIGQRDGESGQAEHQRIRSDA